MAARISGRVSLLIWYVHFLSPKHPLSRAAADPFCARFRADKRPRPQAKVKETISLTTVPPLPLQLGLAGTLPYLGTSIATMYLSWDLNTTWPTDSSLLNSVMVSHDTARQLLGHLEPLQLGYGAVIISFLGAIHWGLEFAEKKVDYDSSLQGRERARFRYGLGVAASVVAWPSVLMPVEWALITQFLAFTGLYFADSRATTRGWTPPWYSTYRFVLTFVVGSAILLSLVGRARIGEGEHVLTKHNVKEGMYKLAKNEKLPNWEKLEQEEREKKKKEKEEKEEEERRKKKEEEEKKKAKEKEKKEGKKDGKGGKGGKDGDKSEEKKDDDDSGEGGSDGDGKGSDSGEGDTEKKD
jgi:hypothetical protein